MPAFLDFISVFGWQSEPRGLRFSGFKGQSLPIDPSRYPPATDLGRSGRQFQICYNLRSVSRLTGPEQALEWSIRQAAFYHHFDVVFGTTLWIVAKGDLEMKNRIQRLTGIDGRPEDRAFATPEESFRSSLAVHLLHSHWAIEGWLWYIQWMEDRMDKEASKYAILLLSTVLTTPLQGQVLTLDPNLPQEPRKQLTPEDLASAQFLENKTNEALMIIESNANILTSLRNFYTDLLKDDVFSSRQQCRGDVLSFSASIQTMLSDIRRHTTRARRLARIAADRRSLVST
jgi:hypothetical protein